MRTEISTIQEAIRKANSLLSEFGKSKTIDYFLTQFACNAISLDIAGKALDYIITKEFYN
jgi:hypothetical protein